MTESRSLDMKITCSRKSGIMRVDLVRVDEQFRNLEGAQCQRLCYCLVAVDVCSQHLITISFFFKKDMPVIVMH